MRRPEVLKVLSASVLTVALVIGVCGKGYSAKNVYDFKSAEVEIKTVDPMGNVITDIVRIDKWGEYEARHSSSIIKMLGMEQKHESFTYTDRNENVVYNYNPKINQATKIDVSEFMGSMNKGNKQYVYSEEALKEWGGKKIRTEDFLGLKCDVVEFSQFFSTVWFHKKFPVKSETNMGGMKVKSEAVRFEEGVSFAKEDIMLPKGVKIVDAPNLGNIMGQINAGKNMQNQAGEEGSGRHLRNESNPGEMPDMEKAIEAMQKMFGNKGQ